MGFDVRASALKWPPLDQTPAVRPDLLSCLVSQLWLRDRVGSWSLTLALLAGKSQAFFRVSKCPRCLFSCKWLLLRDIPSPIIGTPPGHPKPSLSKPLPISGHGAILCPSVSHLA